jgi:hypothetical protein
LTSFRDYFRIFSHPFQYIRPARRQFVWALQRREAEEDYMQPLQARYRLIQTGSRLPRILWFLVGFIKASVTTKSSNGLEGQAWCDAVEGRLIEGIVSWRRTGF